MNNNIPLWPTPVAGGFQPFLTPYLLPRASVTNPAIIICPGGGYTCRVEHEKANVARCFNGFGFSCFVLEYRLPADSPHPAPQQDALRAVKLLRARSAEFGTRHDAVAVMGFSAGGHLASTTAYLWETLDASAGDAADAESARPDATVLAYAVISGVESPHAGSFQRLLASPAPPRDALCALSAELHVNGRTPPSFIWHTEADATVPSANSLNYAAALSRARIPYALHIFPFGGHGKSIGADDPAVGAWPALCADFLRQLGF